MSERGTVPRVSTTRPEMILVIHDVEAGSYRCRIFYKEPRQAGSVEAVNVAAGLGVILELRSGPPPVVRLIAEKVEEFHALREKLAGEGEAAPGRRVFYAPALPAAGRGHRAARRRGGGGPPGAAGSSTPTSSGRLVEDRVQRRRGAARIGPPMVDIPRPV